MPGEESLFGDVARLIEGARGRVAARYGRGYSKQTLLRMIGFADAHPHAKIVSTPLRQFTLGHLLQLMALKHPGEQKFYEGIAWREYCCVRTLAQQIQRQLYQRTLGGRSAAGLAADLADVTADVAAPELALRDPYVLDFLGLEAAYSEADLECAIIDEMQRFLLELGGGCGAGGGRLMRRSDSSCRLREYARRDK